VEILQYDWLMISFFIERQIRLIVSALTSSPQSQIIPGQLSNFFSVDRVPAQ